MYEATILFIVKNEVGISKFCLEQLLRNTPDQVAIRVLISARFENKKQELLTVPDIRLEIDYFKESQDLYVVINQQLETVATNYFAVVQSSTIVPPDWYIRLKSVFEDFQTVDREHLAHSDLLAALPKCNYAVSQKLASSFHFQQTQQYNQQLECFQLQHLLRCVKSLYGQELASYNKALAKTSEKWYTIIQALEYYCILFVTDAFKRIAKVVDIKEDFLLESTKQGYYIARVDNCFVHYQGIENVTEDSESEKLSTTT